MTYKFKSREIVQIDNIKLRVIKPDPIASRIYGTPYYICQLVGRKCTDSYSQERMIKVI